jgi:hypothetical protein
MGSRYFRDRRLALVLAAVMSAVTIFAGAPAFAEGGPAATRPAESSHLAGPVTTDQEALNALNLDAPGMAEVKAAAPSGNLSAVAKAYLGYRRTACRAQWFVMPADKPKIQFAVPPEDKAGDQIINHIIPNSYWFPPLSGDMGKVFDWKSNPVPRSSPGFTYEWTYCVISRTGFWKLLADAYWKTTNEKYAQAWVDQFLDFVNKNLCDAVAAKGDPSLWRTLDASERMYDAWPYCYAHFLNSPAFTPAAQWIYLRSVLDHVRILKAGLAVPGRTGNWVASECYALYAIGALFPELKEASQWRDLATARMVEEMDHCVPPDGFEAELTPNYHYFTLSSFLGPMRAAQLNHYPLPAIFREKILAMYRAPVWVMDQSGNDVSTNDSNQWNAAKQAAKGLKWLGEDPLLEWAASGGTKGVAPPTSTMLPYAGFYVMRGGWDPLDSFLFFRAGPTGIAHEHEDMLEIVLRAWNKTLLFEQGTYPYDQSIWRRFVLGTSSHSTIIIDGAGQHRGRSAAPVKAPMPNPWVATPIFDFVAGTYDGGYQQSVQDPNALGFATKYVGPIDHSVTHTRRIVFFKPYYALVLDTVDGSGTHDERGTQGGGRTHTIDALFHLDSPAATMDKKTQAIFSQNAGDVQLALYPLGLQNLQTQIVQGQTDPVLGWYAIAHRAIPTVRFRKVQAAPARFATFLYPYRGEAPEFSEENLKAGDGVWAAAFHTEMEDASVALSMNNSQCALALPSPDAAVSVDGALSAQSAGLIVRRRSADGSVFVGGWKLSKYWHGKWSFAANAPADLVWQETGDALLIFNAGDAACSVSISLPFKAIGVVEPGTWTRIAVNGATHVASPVLFQRIDSPSNVKP